MPRRKRIKGFIALLLVVTLLFSTVGCSSSPPNASITKPGEEQILVENTEVEDIITEEILMEHITEEIYLEEIVIAEEQITELLLEEETINEVILCKTIYVPEEHIEEFCEHSQTAQLFGEDFDIKPVLTKVAIGTGIIVTIAIVNKVGVPKPVASIVAAAADESLKFAKSGAVVGTVFGAFTGAADEIDESGRASAIAGFALATAGLIITAVSLVGAVPSGGTSGFGVAEGVHLAWAGIKFVGAAVGEVVAARNTVKAFTSTDVAEIDWDNIDWDAVGVATAQRAIQNGADGYMWGTIYGAVDGGVEAYYQKYCTPYTRYQDRIKHLKQMVEKGTGTWTGAEGESDFILNEPILLNDGTKVIEITKVTYRNGVPDFSPYALETVEIPAMTVNRQGAGGNYEQADTALARQWNEAARDGRTNWTSTDVKNWRESYPIKLTWHEMSNMETMQLVPYEVNDTFKHYGGVAECKAMIRQTGGTEYD